MVANLPRLASTCDNSIETAAEIRVKGTVQGVGFRPTVYQLAHGCGLRGEVYNDAAGVVIRVAGTAEQIERFVAQLHLSPPPLARIDSIKRSKVAIATIPHTTFTITPSRTGHSRTQISPDAATCPQCLSDTLNPTSRFYRYPFTNCTHCGPRLSIIRAIPYDRPNTSMAEFPMCPTCHAEYDDPLNRRFHAQPVACPHCGPKVWLESADGTPVDCASFSRLDAVDAVGAVGALLQHGHILAIKGIGGIHLACDATNEQAVSTLRDRKHRHHKPFALMVRDLSVIEPYCTITDTERALLESPAAPIVVLRRKNSELSHHQSTSVHPDAFCCQQRYGNGDASRFLNATGATPFTLASLPPSTPPALPPSLSPNLPTLGVMLPYTPLHHLMLKNVDFPIVLTSGNVADEPQCITNDEARSKLSGIASYFLLHDRAIVNRVDDSVVRVVQGKQQTLRRARGYAPAPIRLPAGFEEAPPILAMGSELKSTFCLSRNGEAILSQHLGDLENMAAFDAYQDTLRLYQNVFEHEPAAIAHDLHPDYLSTKLGKKLSEKNNVPLYGVQHHHAHITAAMVEHGLPIDTPSVLGIALDGLGYGDDDTLWGGEFLVANYRTVQRVAHFEAIAMLGGAQATRQPWRNTYAHLMNAMDWDTLTEHFGDLDLVQFLRAQPRSVLDHMLRTGVRSPLASSAGRLFDAVAAAVGCCREAASYEGQGAIELEALIDPNTPGDGRGMAIHDGRDMACPSEAMPQGYCPYDNYFYPFAIKDEGDRPILSAAPMWQNLLDDIQHGVEPSVIAARFHYGLARAIAHLAIQLAHAHNLTQVVLSGGVFQNQVLLVAVHTQLEQAGLQVVIPHDVPPNDGGIALGQVAIAAARLLTPSLPDPP